jgi:hypothetical protein
MRAVFRRAGVAGLGLLLAGCGLHPDPPPSFPATAFGGTGDLMARCMQYASQSYCEQDIWGGEEH